MTCILIKTFADKSRGFRRDEQGAIAVLFAISVFVLALIVAGAIEISRRGLTETELQHSLDSAALAGRMKYESELLAGTPQSTAKSRAEAIATAMFDEYIKKSKNFEAKPVLNIAWQGQALILTSDANMQLLTGDFMPDNVKQLSVSAKSEMTTGTSYEVALMLDNSTSMKNKDGRPQSRMTLLRGAAVNFAHDMFDYAVMASNGAVPVQNPMRMAVVPWGVSVNVKTEVPGSKDYSGTRGNTVIGDGGSGSPVSNPIDRTMDVALDSTVFSSRSQWSGCLRALDDPMTTYSDAKPSNGWKTLGVRNNSYGYGKNSTCPTAMLGLSANRGQVVSTINRMTFAEGGTHADVGLRWGLRALSPNNGWPTFFGSGSSAPFNHYGTKKIAVLITDGENTQASAMPGMWGCSGNYESSCNGAPSASQLNTMMLGWCSALKNNGVDVYTVALNVTNAYAVGLLRDCASAPNKAYSIDAANVSSTLRSIAQTAMRLQLTQ